jgi:hypothetical protein
MSKTKPSVSGTRGGVLNVKSLDQLRQLWVEAVESDEESLDPDEVFDALERKYSAMVKESPSA